MDECCPSILIVDDNGDNIIVLGLYCKLMRFTSDSANNGKEAIEMILARKEKDCNCSYTLILLDCNMPVMDGYTACKKLREMIK